MENKKRLNLIIGFIYILYTISTILFLKEKKLLELGIVAFCIAATFILGLGNKKLNKLIDDSIYLNLVFFIMVASLLGSCFKFYSINYYDDFLHLYSGVLSCNVAYLIIKYFNSKDAIKNMNKIFIIIFLFMFTMGVASLWEIMEFSLDNLLGMNTQVGGLKDTMIDIIDALIGVLISIPYFTNKIKNRYISN